MPTILRGAADIDDAMSPQRPKTTKRRINYNMLATVEEWINFRTTPHSGHVPSHIPTLVRDDFYFFPSSAEKSVDKRKTRKEKPNNFDQSTPQ